MKYDKKSLTIAEQADLLLARGLLCKSKQYLISKLMVVSYYRLSAYLYPYKKNDSSEDFVPKTSLRTIWRRYTFDRQLRLLMMDLIERFEISIRTQILNFNSIKYGPFGYLEKTSFPKMKQKNYEQLISKIKDSTEKSHDYSKLHFFEKYDDEIFLPIWIACESIDFGTVSKMYEGLDPIITEQIASFYKINKEVLRNWLRAISYTRNLCAHHQRVWNRIWSIQPFIPEDERWKKPVIIKDDNLFGILSVLCYLQKIIAPQSNWRKRFQILLKKYRDIPLEQMGFPKNWKKSQIWRN